MRPLLRRPGGSEVSAAVARTLTRALSQSSSETSASRPLNMHQSAITDSTMAREPPSATSLHSLRASIAETGSSESSCIISFASSQTKPSMLSAGSPLRTESFHDW